MIHVFIYAILLAASAFSNQGKVPAGNMRFRMGPGQLNLQLNRSISHE